MVCNLLKKEIMFVETVATLITMKYTKNLVYSIAMTKNMKMIIR